LSEIQQQVAVATPPVAHQRTINPALTHTCKHLIIGSCSFAFVIAALESQPKGHRLTQSFN
jgi:hypothetical protein